MSMRIRENKGRKVGGGGHYSLTAKSCNRQQNSRQAAAWVSERHRRVSYSSSRAISRERDAQAALQREVERREVERWRRERRGGVRGERCERGEMRRKEGNDRRDE